MFKFRNFIKMVDKIALVFDAPSTVLSLFALLLHLLMGQSYVFD